MWKRTFRSLQRLFELQREDASRGDAAANHPALCFRDVALNQVARHGQQGRKGERNDKCLLIRQGGKEKEHVEKNGFARRCNAKAVSH